jgi:ABC-type transporter Mla subunit MlaD
VRNTGAVFAALNRRSGELQQLIVNSDHLFSATQQERGSLATIFEIFPTFLDESRTTLARLQTFSANADPVVNALKPVADELRPVLPDARALAGPLDRLFSVIPPLVHAARPNLPQAVRFLRGLPPLFVGLNAFLPELNPILSFANWQQHVFGQFIAGPGSGVAPLPPLSPGGPVRQYLRQFGAIDNHSLSLQPTQQSWMRGNAYNAPNAYTRALYLGAVESFTCAPAGGPQRDPQPAKMALPCFLAPPSLWDHRIFPHLNRGQAPLLRPPSDLAGTTVVPTNLPPFGK